jgi:hypothetical protein
MSAGPSLPSRAFLASSLISWLICSTPFLSASLITGTTRPLGVSAAKPMWKYCFSTSCSPSRLALNSGNFFSAATAGLDQEGQHRDLDAALLVFLVQLDAEGFELGDVRVVVVGDVRDEHPVAVQVGAADLLDAAEVLALDGAELGSRPAARPAGRGCPARRRPPAAGALAFCAAVCTSPAITPLTKPCTSSCVMRPLGPLPLTSASGTPSSRASGGWWARRAAAAPRGHVAAGRRVPGGAPRRCGLVRRRSAGGAAAGPAAARSGCPWRPCRPTLTFSSCSTPACDDGISIDALSLRP